MGCTNSKSVGGHVESPEYVLASHFAAVTQVQTSAVVHSSPGEDQELKIDTCALGSGSSPSSESKPKKDTSTTTAHSTELPTTEATTSRGGVEPMYSGSAPKCEWTEALPEEEDPSGEETNVYEEDEQAMIRGVEPIYSGSAPKGECTETLQVEEHPSGEETSDDEHKESTTSGEDPSSKEDEEATTSGGVRSISSGTEHKSYWTPILPAKEEDPSGVETSVNKEDEKLCFPLVRRISPSELKIVRKLAEGGQAKIFLAMYLKTQQDVVVKRYTSCEVQAGKLQRQMERVMKACEKRQESGLCRVIGVSVDKKGRVSTVMQLMGGDLRDFIDRNPCLDYGERLGLMKAIASGIKELHGCGIIHKDLKAANILLSHKDTPLLSHSTGVPEDYRSPRHFLYDTPNYRHLRMTITRNSRGIRVQDWVIDVKVGDYESSDRVGGTAFFRAPEVFRALRDGTEVEYTAAVDVYGFGMICYELLTGKYPFQGHPLADYDLVPSGKRPDVSDEPPRMRELLHRCWDDDPHQRPGWDEILQILGKELHLWTESDYKSLRSGG
ncbi:unnamed protein product [Sphagnum troendelagicum]|uniref:Protein kinase domain-containing protein n=1 Tax=Sphagnum troendelagicum TaxID=128251 RepID=A0ABP0T948_9BRYO